ncbi:MAG: hypothetical protein QOD06_2492 [Candidatus Binatota bacterium]|jgi:ABC-type transporter Mla MlaB component|nr:hypothetical protein [Candidatus Binatota bacterium]
MLKIVRSTDGDFVLFTLSGRIDVEHAVELQACFRAERDRVVLDLVDVKRVDRDAMAFLERWDTEGIALENCPAHIREWIAKARAQKGRT